MKFKKMVILCLLEAKHKTAWLWKAVQRPSKQSWVEGLMQCIANGKN